MLHILALLRRPVTYMHCAAGMPHLLSIPIECTNPTRRVWGFGNRPIFVCGQMHYFPPLVRPKENSSALQGRWPAGPEGFPMHKSNFSLFSRPVYVVRGCVRCCVPVGVRPLQAGQFCPPHGEQKGRYDPKIRMSRNACENRQIVLFWLIFVTRLLRNSAQIADFCAIFLHKTGLLCRILSVSFTFWAV